MLQYAYNNAGLLTSESLNGLVVSNLYDGLNRRITNGLASGSTWLVMVTNGYDAASRLAAVSDRTNLAQYAYLTNSALVGNIAFSRNGASRMNTAKNYDHLDRLTNALSTPTGAGEPSLGLGYAYNAANQRSQATLADGSYWVYEYDNLGQVTSGKKYWSDGTRVAGQQFEYAFDSIGNRTWTKAGGDASGANLRQANYSSNSLNQYTQRTVPGYVNVLGAATNTATVTVNNQATSRKGEYYRAEPAVNNAAGPIWLALTNVGVLANGTNWDWVTNCVGNLFVPQTPQNFAYDADGNLTNDGRWSYTWDGENRLVRVQALPGVPGPANALEFGYDGLGRRISKTVSNWTGSAWVVAKKNRYVYDGWNLLAELNATNNAVIASFVWGLDLSGTAQGSGGVGGLLSVTCPGEGVYFAVVDGNGNIAGLVRAEDGIVSAIYEYGPFGELIRASGPAARKNPLRFSTKYQDEESDLLYYGFRYYNPSTGRWLSRDPMEEGGGLNLYGFVGNDAIQGFDSLGMTTDSAFRARRVAIRLWKAAQQIKTDYEQSFLVGTTHYVDAVLKIASVYDKIYEVTTHGKVPTYNPKTDTISYIDNNPSPRTPIHEGQHAYADVILHFTANSAYFDRMDEGMSYLLDAFIDGPVPRLKSMERNMTSNKGCSAKKSTIIYDWQNFWNHYGTIPSDNWGSGEGPYAGNFRLSAADVRTVQRYYGLKLSCKDLANAANALIMGKGCCYRVTCDSTTTNPEVEIPAGVVIQDVFK